MNTKIRGDKEEAETNLIKSFLQSHNLKTNSLVHDAGLVISSQKVKQFESDIDSHKLNSEIPLI